MISPNIFNVVKAVLRGLRFLRDPDIGGHPRWREFKPEIVWNTAMGLALEEATPPGAESSTSSHTKPRCVVASGERVGAD